ncbi:Type IV secretion system protein virB5 [Pseudomonas fluorescens]|uniref:type IV secretion system protein n=1 Tax=Pseudomonas fluorescens TaxID=294 RepID=UPI00125C0B31|nr:type IV secretion system protein [Pseudomonas fluorescens]VVN22344.1 Type IV secretion system protein virB5 [Pseudomonas fluorescens]
MNKTIRVLAISVALATAVAAPTSYAIIPTTDVAAIGQSILNATQQAAQAAAQLAELTRQIEQAKAQFDELKDLTTGNSRYGSRYNDPEMYTYLPTATTAGSWEQIYTNMDSSVLNGYRNKYGLITKNATQQKVYDRQLTNLRTLEGAYRANNLRLENLKKLQEEADRATTPQEKDDIRARLQVEQSNINNEANRLATTQDLMERQDKMMAHQQNREFDKFLSGE